MIQSQLGHFMYRLSAFNILDMLCPRRALPTTTNNIKECTVKIKVGCVHWFWQKCSNLYHRNTCSRTPQTVTKQKIFREQLTFKPGSQFKTNKESALYENPLKYSTMPLHNIRNLRHPLQCYLLSDIVLTRPTNLQWKLQPELN